MCVSSFDWWIFPFLQSLVEQDHDDPDEIPGNEEETEEQSVSHAPILGPNINYDFVLSCFMQIF